MALPATGGLWGRRGVADYVEGQEGGPDKRDSLKGESMYPMVHNV